MFKHTQGNTYVGSTDDVYVSGSVESLGCSLTPGSSGTVTGFTCYNPTLAPTVYVPTTPAPVGRRRAHSLASGTGDGFICHLAGTGRRPI